LNPERTKVERVIEMVKRHFLQFLCGANIFSQRFCVKPKKRSAAWIFLPCAMRFRGRSLPAEIFGALEKAIRP